MGERVKMGNVGLAVTAALVSGLLATVVTIWWQKRSRKYTLKLKIFETMMSYRYMIHAEESVKAINSIDVVFYEDEKVRKALSAFLNETAKKPDFNPQIEDKHLKLLEEMAKALKLKSIHWDDIKQSYYPNELAQKNQDEEMLRKLQVQNAIETARRNNEQQNTPADRQFGEQLAMRLLPDLIKNPDALKMLIEIGAKEGK